MSFPGYPDSFDPGWWRVQVITPPYFSGLGDTTNGTTAITNFAASYQMQTITPLAGQQVSGTGIAAGTTIVSVSDAADFVMSQAATANGTGVSLTIGAEPATLAEAKAWARVEFDDDDSLVQDIIEATRNAMEGPDLKRAIMLQSRCCYFMGFPWSGGYYNRLIRSMGPNPWWLPTAQGIIMLPYPPLQSIVSIKYTDPSSGDLLAIDPSKIVSTPNSTPGRVQPQYGTVWPLSRPVIDSVQITYTCGYGPLESDIPGAIRIALRSVIAATYENREAYLEGAGLVPTPIWKNFLSVEEWGTYV